MATLVARQEKRQTEVEAPVETSQPERVPPPQPSRAVFPLVPTAPPVVQLYGMQPPGMPVGVPLMRPVGSEQIETT